MPFGKENRDSGKSIMQTKHTTRRSKIRKQPLEQPIFQETTDQRLAVLITSISSKIPMIDAVRHAVNKSSYFQRIIGCDCNEDCIGKYAVDYFWNCAPLKKLEKEDILAFCEENRVKAIIPTRADDLLFYAHHRAHFRNYGIHVMVSSLETIVNCLDKKKFSDILLKAGYPAIPTYLSLREVHSSFYVVKERRSGSSRDVGLRLSRHQAAECSKQLAHPIFQPYIQGVEWSVDVYRSFQGEMIGSVARERNVVMNGESQITTTSRYPLLENMCQEIADLLEIEGHAVFQVIESKKGKFHIVECHPRFGGTSTASVAVGLDSFYWFFIECLGLPLHEHPFDRIIGEIRQIRYKTDRIYPWSPSSV
jgi:carbamoyl-phosphate synthase large subunit